jgi:hypothetical protein
MVENFLEEFKTSNNISDIYSGPAYPAGRLSGIWFKSCLTLVLVRMTTFIFINLSK